MFINENFLLFLKFLSTVKPCHYMTINPMMESPTVEIVTGSDGLRFPNAVRGDEMTSFQTSKPPVIAATALSPSCLEMTYGDHSDYVPMVTPTGESYMVMAARRFGTNGLAF